MGDGGYSSYTYIGSKAKLPEGLVHWKLGQNEF
jgi:hypothetical protein